MGGHLLSWLRATHEDEHGDVPGWVMIVLMTASLVVVIWGVARDRLVAIVGSALSTVCGPVGC
ncbi:MAG TPA: hypothetical protein VHI71_09325 [Actinomycetota bacterium]|nr:hypothetical protein [Actinomycetota bacterium]